MASLHTPTLLPVPFFQILGVCHFHAVIIYQCGTGAWRKNFSCCWVNGEHLDQAHENMYCAILFMEIIGTTCDNEDYRRMLFKKLDVLTEDEYVTNGCLLNWTSMIQSSISPNVRCWRTSNRQWGLLLLALIGRAALNVMVWRCSRVTSSIDWDCWSVSPVFKSRLSCVFSGVVLNNPLLLIANKMGERIGCD